MPTVGSGVMNFCDLVGAKLMVGGPEGTYFKLGLAIKNWPINHQGHIKPFFLSRGWLIRHNLNTLNTHVTCHQY